jgi:hypothetical protein
MYCVERIFQVNARLISCVICAYNIHCSSVVGTAATRWKRHLDAYLDPATPFTDKEMHLKESLKYPDSVYEGVNFKSGVQLNLPRVPQIFHAHNPKHLFYNPPNRVLGHKSILGLIYDIGVSNTQEILLESQVVESGMHWSTSFL